VQARSRRRQAISVLAITIVWSVAVVVPSTSAMVLCVGQDAATGQLLGEIEGRDTSCAAGEVQVGRVVDAASGVVDFQGRERQLPATMVGHPAISTAAAATAE